MLSKQKDQETHRRQAQVSALLSLVRGAGHEVVVGGTHRDGDDLVGVPGEESEKAVVVQRKVPHGVVRSVRVRAHKHGLHMYVSVDACVVVGGFSTARKREGYDRRADRGGRSVSTRGQEGICK